MRPSRRGDRRARRGVHRAVAHRKPHLPEKTCASCHRPFAWRKKWARDWEQVKYCSDRCRGAGKRPSI
ncbi:DUF2256 domain-containing protein [Sphingomonas sp. CCH9-F2]|uniref:DUF2256 domain-containing protein n=1 Tax=Sphingomonas sp. CCH9-F2 TaxID=1768778 RepID=UPI000A43ED87